MDVGAPQQVGDHTAAGVVGRGNHGDGLGGDVDAEIQALLIDAGKTGLDEVLGLMADIQKDAVVTGLFEFGVDGPGHHVPEGQILQGVVFGHEGRAVFIHENPAFAPHCFGNEEIFGLGVVQTGGVKLDEFHVGNVGPGPVGDGHPVAGGDIRVAGIEIDLAGATGGQQDDGGNEGVDLTGVRYRERRHPRRILRHW